MSASRTAKCLFQMIASFFRKLFRRVPELTAPSPAEEEQVMRRVRQYGNAKRRRELKDSLHRIDGGGKHYGSKRAFSNHRGSGHGKRSGRQ